MPNRGLSAAWARKNGTEQQRLVPVSNLFGPETRGYRLYTPDGLTLDETRRFSYLTTGDENCFHRLAFQHGVAVVLLLTSSEWVS